MKKDRISEAMLTFNFFEKISPRRFKIIMQYFSDPYQAINASVLELEKAGLKQEIALSFYKFKNTFDFFSTIKKLALEKIEFTHLYADDYPEILKETQEPPIVIYYRGKINPWPENTLAVVGARKHSYYGQKAVKELLAPLSSTNIAIISGLALGIDSLAHQSALENNNLTYAILGSGIREVDIYPPENYSLSERIIKSGGALISEFPPGTSPEKYNFPRRNRIIAGLSKAVLVIEAKNKSGSLISAKRALDENRDVLAVPGSIFSELSAGTNNLIASGAKMIYQTKDILDNFPNLKIKNKIPKQNKETLVWETLTDKEKLIYSIIKESSKKEITLSSDEISNLSKLDSSLINSTLSILEIAGMIKRDGPAYILS
jgi:DNA processing protein